MLSVRRLFFCHKLVVSSDEELEKLSHSEVGLREKKQYNDKRRRRKLKRKEQEEVRN